MEEEDGGWKAMGKDVGSDELQALEEEDRSTVGLAVLQGQAQLVQSQGRIQKDFC